jgi:hypothetical protein
MHSYELLINKKILEDWDSDRSEEDGKRGRREEE